MRQAGPRSAPLHLARPGGGSAPDDSGTETGSRPTQRRLEVRRIENTHDAAVLEHHRRATPPGGKTLQGDRVQRVAGSECRRVAIGGVGHHDGAGSAREPVGCYQADVPGTVDHRQHAAR